MGKGFGGKTKTIKDLATTMESTDMIKGAGKANLFGLMVIHMKELLLMKNSMAMARWFSKKRILLMKDIGNKGDKWVLENLRSQEVR